MRHLNRPHLVMLIGVALAENRRRLPGFIRRLIGMTYESFGATEGAFFGRWRLTVCGIALPWISTGVVCE